MKKNTNTAAGHTLDLFDGNVHEPAATKPNPNECFCPVYRIALIREKDVPSYGSASSPADVYAITRPLFEQAARERMVVLLLSTANEVIGASVVSQGGLAATILEPRMVFELAFAHNAAAVVLLHNHPSGNPEPSREDIRITRQIAEAGRLLSVPVHDHLIVTEHGYTSLAERGLLS